MQRHSMEWKKRETKRCSHGIVVRRNGTISEKCLALSSCRLSVVDVVCWCCARIWRRSCRCSLRFRSWLSAPGRIMVRPRLHLPRKSRKSLKGRKLRRNRRTDAIVIAPMRRNKQLVNEKGSLGRTIALSLNGHGAYCPDAAG